MKIRRTLGTTTLVVATTALVPLAAEEEITRSVAISNNDFAFDLYARLAEGRAGENLFFSPASISTALAMTSVGARGATATEMARAMHWALEGDELHRGMGSLAASLDGERAGYTLALANALWGQKGLGFDRGFLESTRRHYGAELGEVDFARETDGARRTINAWVEERTRDRIRELLKPGDVTPDTALVLTNAIWFKGTWKLEFDPELTHEAAFRTADGTESAVDLMQIRGEVFRYFEEEGLQGLEMPYQGDELSMLILLPAPKSSLDQLERRLSSEVLDGWLSGMRSVKMTSVQLPRFETRDRFRLSDTLREMGMELAFSGEADFSGITRERSLRIDEVVHEAFVKVNEEGTEAAAATGVVMKTTSISVPRIFRADRPFLFLIRDHATGAVLFLGRLASPE